MTKKDFQKHLKKLKRQKYRARKRNRDRLLEQEKYHYLTISVPVTVVTDSWMYFQQEKP